MITNPLEYYNSIQQIKDLNKPQYAILLPSDEKIYNIDLNTRKVDAPQYLSVKSDHYAETIYFTVDRYYDNMDIADTVCTIQYTNSGVKTEDGEKDPGRSYLVPFYDITTYKEEGKILLPWQISGEVTRAAGDITFSFRFFKLNSQAPIGERDCIYSLNTVPATSKILHGMNLDPENNENLYIPQDAFTQLTEEIERVSRQSGLYWIEV